MAAAHRRCRTLVTAAALIAWIVWLAAPIAALAAGDAGDADTSRDISVTVKTVGEVVTIDTSFHVDASPEVAWGVLTDFDHMTAIVSNLESSRVLSRAPNKLVVAQAGKATWGVVTYAFDNVREVELSPFTEIRSHLISGTMRKMEGLTHLRPENNGTRITSHGEFIPDLWLPPVVGVKFVEGQTRKQFDEMRGEMVRRYAKGSVPSTVPSSTPPAPSAAPSVAPSPPPAGSLSNPQRPAANG